MLRILLKYCKRPWGTNFWPQFGIFTVLWAVFPHLCPNKCEISNRVRHTIKKLNQTARLVDIIRFLISWSGDQGMLYCPPFGYATDWHKTPLYTNALHITHTTQVDIQTEMALTSLLRSQWAHNLRDCNKPAATVSRWLAHSKGMLRLVEWLNCNQPSRAINCVPTPTLTLQLVMSSRMERTMFCLESTISYLRYTLWFKKNVPTLADYNYDPVQSILIIF